MDDRRADTRAAAPAAPVSRRGSRAVWPAVAVAAIAAAMVGILRGQGRSWWCACGGWAPASVDAWGPHNSQHLFDPYSFSHLLHGVLFYGVLALALPRVARGWRLALALVVEAGWELFENSSFVIERYRAATAALGYEGDSVINSLGDLLSCAFGFWLAGRLGLWWSAAVLVAVELVMLACIRDNLTLNVVMLVWPIDAVRTWQAGG